VTSSEQRHLYFLRRWPKLAVLFVAAGLTGIAIGALGALSLSLGFTSALPILTLLFVLSWGIAAVTFAVFAFRAASGSYRSIEAKPWKDQIW